MNIEESELRLCVLKAKPAVRLHRYKREEGSEPLTDWLNRLRDKSAAARIRLRLRQIEAGNFGDSKSVGTCVTEMRIHTGIG